MSTGKGCVDSCDHTRVQALYVACLAPWHVVSMGTDMVGCRQADLLQQSGRRHKDSRLAAVILRGLVASRSKVGCRSCAGFSCYCGKAGVKEDRSQSTPANRGESLWYHPSIPGLSARSSEVTRCTDTFCIRHRLIDSEDRSRNYAWSIYLLPVYRLD